MCGVSLFNVTDGSLDHVHNGGVKNPKVRHVRLKALVQEQWQLVREHPQRTRLVHLEIIRELQRAAVWRHQEVGVGRVLVRVPVRVPTANAVLVHLGVEQGAGVLVHRRTAGLGVGAPGPEHLILIVAVRRDASILDDLRGHGKLSGTGQRMEVQSSEPVVPDRWQGHAEYPVGPLEVMAAHVEITVQRVEVEIMVLHSPGRVGRQAVHH